LREKLEPLDLTHVQFIILAGFACLSINEEHVTQIMIAKHVNIDVMMACVVIRKLEQKEFILREDHPRDTRAKLLVLTTLGVARFQEAMSIVEDFDQSFFSVLGDREIAFNDLSNRLVY
jgi:Transcriptional regulators